MSDTVKTSADTNETCQKAAAHYNMAPCFQEPVTDRPEDRPCLTPVCQNGPKHAVKDCPQHEFTLDVIEDAPLPWNLRLEIALKRFNTALIEQFPFMLGLLSVIASTLNYRLAHAMTDTIGTINTWTLPSWFAIIIVVGFAIRGSQRGMHIVLPAQLCSVDNRRNLMSCIFCGVIMNQAYLSLVLTGLLYLAHASIIVIG